MCTAPAEAPSKATCSPNDTRTRKSSKIVGKSNNIDEDPSVFIQKGLHSVTKKSSAIWGQCVQLSRFYTKTTGSGSSLGGKNATMTSCQTSATNCTYLTHKAIHLFIVVSYSSPICLCSSYIKDFALLYSEHVSTFIVRLLTSAKLTPIRTCML